MKNLLALLRIQRIMSWRTFREKLGGGQSKWGLLLIPLVFIGFVPLVGLITGMYIGLFVAAKAIGQAHILIALALTAGQVVCLMFGVFYVISAFYFSKDLSVLVPLPIRPGEIVLAKFIGILAGEYLTIAPVVVPALLVYGILADVSWTYIPFAVLIYLLLPVIPLVVASLFSIVLMRITNMRRNRDLWRVVGALVGVGFALSFQMIMRLGQTNGKFDPEKATEQIQLLLESQQSLVAMVGKYVPTSLWATNALREGAPAFGAGSFLLYAAVAVAALLLLLWAAEKLFFGGLLGGEDVRSAGKAITGEELTRETSQIRTPLWALLQREMRLLNRTPTFLMAALMPPLMMPIAIAIPLSQGGELMALVDKAGRLADSPLIPVIAIGVVLFFNMMSNVGATAISREGRHFWISRSLPVAPRVQVQAKILHSLMFSVLNIALVLGGLAFLGLLRPLTLVYVVIGGLVGGAGTNYAGILIDLLRPQLDWTDPQQAMKGNLNVLFAMLLSLVTMLVLGGVAAAIYFVAEPLVVPVIILLFAAEAVILDRVVGALADRRYVQYEH